MCFWRSVDLKRSPANSATAVRPPIDLPSWGHVAQLRDLSRFRRDSRPLASAEADRAHAHRQLPLLEKDELPVVVSLQRPGHQLSYGLAPTTQLLGTAAAASHYTCLFRMIASQDCRFLKIPRAEYYDDFGIVVP